MGLAAVLQACAPVPVRYTVVPPPTAEAIALTGDTLWSLPLDPAGGPARVKRLADARLEAEKRPFNADATLRLAASTAAMGRIREAVAILTEATGTHATDPRLRRFRGEYLLWLRERDRAIAEFQAAGRLSLGKASSPEWIETATGGRLLTTTRFQIEYLLGVTLYCKGELARARDVLADAIELGISGDDRARAALWHFFATRRLGNREEAAALLQSVPDAWLRSTRRAEVALLLAFRGEMPTDTIRARALGAQGGEAAALYSYAMGYSLLLVPEREEEARRWLARARSGPDWTSLPYIAAEADLARVGRAREVDR